jgi:hypothetical protein
MAGPEPTLMLVPTDYPQRLAARGLDVNVYAGWESHGGGADHRAVVLHHTASSSGTPPKADADYCHSGADASPLYNVLVDRAGVVWLLAREKSNSSGDISGVALNEALEGRADLTPAAVRYLPDTTSNNGALFAICGQNNGTGEHWSAALLDAMTVCAAVALECLGLAHAGYVTTHRALTARKIDPDGPGCPDDWHSPINAALGGAPAPAGRGELMLIEQPGRTVDPVRLACAELRPDAQQIIGWNGASLAGDFLLAAGDDRRRGEARVLDLRPYTHGAAVLGWTPGDRGPVVLADGGATFYFDWS